MPGPSARLTPRTGQGLTEQTDTQVSASPYYRHEGLGLPPEPVWAGGEQAWGVHLPPPPGRQAAS